MPSRNFGRSAIRQMGIRQIGRSGCWQFVRLANWAVWQMGKRFSLEGRLMLSRKWVQSVKTQCEVETKERPSPTKGDDFLNLDGEVIWR
ncbi:MAG: hypothetical protein ACK4I8_09305 [Armatimonadota bacterium]